MFVKQIGTEEALKLAVKGHEVLVMVPAGGKDRKWEDYMPGTLQGLLDGCLFFRREPALEEQIQSLSEAPKDRPPDVWIPARLTEKEAGAAAR